MVTSLLSTPIFASSRKKKKMSYGNKLAFVTLFIPTTTKEKNMMVTSLLLLPIFVSSRNKKKMGDGSKLTIVALFIVTTIEEKKYDNKKFVVVMFK
jgi:hypothetical protein